MNKGRSATPDLRSRAYQREVNPVAFYRVRRVGGDVTCWIHHQLGGARQPLPRLARHASAFDVGISGGGAMDLARSILADHLDNRHVGLALYMAFAVDFLEAREHAAGVDLHATAITAWISSHELSEAFQ